MSKKLLLIFFIINMIVLSSSVIAQEENTTTDIQEDITPERARKDINNNSMLYLLSFTLLSCGAYLVYDRSHHQGLKLNVDSIESNNDGSYIVSFGYDNPDNTISFDKGDCGLRVIKGKAIILKRPSTNEFETGLHKDCLIAVINEDSEIEYYAGSKKISIKGKDIKEKEENKE